MVQVDGDVLLNPKRFLGEVFKKTDKKHPTPTLKTWEDHINSVMAKVQIITGYEEGGATAAFKEILTDWFTLYGNTETDPHLWAQRKAYRSDEHVFFKLSWIEEELKRRKFTYPAESTAITWLAATLRAMGAVVNTYRWPGCKPQRAWRLPANLFDWEQSTIPLQQHEEHPL
jgi:hypothetical protein